MLQISRDTFRQELRSFMQDIFQNELEVMHQMFCSRLDEYLLERKNGIATGPLSATILRNQRNVSSDEVLSRDFSTAGFPEVQAARKSLLNRQSSAASMTDGLKGHEHAASLGWMNRQRKSYKAPPTKSISQTLAKQDTIYSEDGQTSNKDSQEDSQEQEGYQASSPRQLLNPCETPRGWSRWMIRHKDSFRQLQSVQERVKNFHTSLLAVGDRTQTSSEQLPSARELEMRPFCEGKGSYTSAGKGSYTSLPELPEDTEIKRFASVRLSSDMLVTKMVSKSDITMPRNRLTGDRQTNYGPEVVEGRRLSVDLFGEVVEEVKGDTCSVLRSFVEAVEFSYMSALLVVINSITIGLQTDYRARQWVDETPRWFRICDQVFCLVFGIELALRLVAHGLCRFFTMNGWEWNAFDFLVVGSQVVEEITQALTNGFHSIGSDKQSKSNISILRILRILRLIRILRLARLLHLLGELRMIIASISASIRSLVWTVFFLLLLMYIIGVYLTQVVTDFKVLNSEVVRDINQPQWVLEQYFGSLDKSMICLYATISEGIHWYEIMAPLTMYISPWLQLVFCFYSGFVIFAVLNIVTGVFVESAIETAKDEKRKVMTYQMQHLFRQGDLDNSGSIDWNEFEVQLKQPQMQEYLKQIDIDPNEARDLFRLLDIEDTGEIELDDLVDGCMRLHGTAKSLDLASFMHEYRRGQCLMEGHILRLQETLASLVSRGTQVSEEYDSIHRAMSIDALVK